MHFPIPSRETTPSEYAVLVVFIAVVFIILGVIALVVAFRAPAEKHELAVALAHRGFWVLGIAEPSRLAVGCFADSGIIETCA